ncbi:hypothetical protein [uncultured Methanoregula sp.]|uniref:hypothetical protein n=1 Tax=uncultured Methanoregula sp. TaxID=1005933 RepID=UPI002AAB77DF|nr:hypothetical protein [uncultured Methanoregula sp.]
MPEIFGIKPRPAAKLLIGKFGHNSQQLIAKVYVDMQDDRWAVTFACNYTRKPGIHGPENLLEVRYSCPARESTSVRMFRPDAGDERTLETTPLKDRDGFIRYVLAEEHSQAGRAA